MVSDRTSYWQQRLGVAEGVLGGLGVRLVVVTVTLVLGILLGRVLGPERFGEYAFAVAVSSLLAVVLGFGFQILVVRWVPIYSRRGEWQLLRGLLVRSTQVVLAGTGVLWAVLVVYIVGSGGPARVSMMILTVSLASAIALGRVWSGAIQGLGAVVVGQVVDPLFRYGVLAVFLGGTLLVGNWVPGSTTALAVHVSGAAGGLILTGLLLWRYLPRDVREAEGKTTTPAWLLESFPLALVSAAQFLNASTDIVMLGMLSAPREVGLYRAAVGLSGVANLGLVAVVVAISPRIAALYAQDKLPQIRRLVRGNSRFLAASTVPVLVLLAIFRTEALVLVFGTDYSEGSGVLWILCLGQVMAILSGPAGAVLRMTGHPNEALFGVSAGAAVNVLLNSLLIPPLGAVGAAIASAVSITVWHVSLAVLASRRVGIWTWSVG